MSIYQRIFTDVETKIISGDWRPGDRIPVEHELAAEYRCSRMTVSKALSALAERGMIVRRRKTGSFVASPQIDRTVMDIQDISTEAELAGHEHRFEILARKVERLERRKRSSCRSLPMRKSSGFNACISSMADRMPSSGGSSCSMLSHGPETRALLQFRPANGCLTRFPVQGQTCHTRRFGRHHDGADPADGTRRGLP